MKSRTSFSKLTAFKKDLTRFAPVWALYLIGMLLVLVQVSTYGDYDDFANDSMRSLVGSFSVVNLIYAAAIAAILFGDLYNTRMCYSLHTQPARREALLASHLAAGMLFSFVPNLLATGYLMLRLEEYWFLALYWLLAVTLQFIFYYGVAVFSALLTGNRVAMLLVYAGIQFVSMLVYWILITIYLPQMKGVVLNMEIFSELCPTVEMVDRWSYFLFEGQRIPSELWPGEFDVFYKYTGLGTGWGYMSILAVVGLVFMGLSVVLYRMRHLEVAGDFVAFPKLKGVASVVITVCFGGVMAFFGEEMLGDGMLLWLIVGIIVGWFGGLMLLERRVRVFRVKSFAGLGILSAVLLGSFLLVAYDVFGVVQWTPQVQEVKSVTLANYYDSSFDYNGGYYYGNRISVTLTEDEDIARIIDAHQAILDHTEEYDGRYQRVVLTYELENGRKVMRNYKIPRSGECYEIVSGYFNTPQNVLGYTDWESYVASIEYLDISGMGIPANMYRTVMEALKADCEKGYVVFEADEKTEHWAEIRYVDPEGRHLSRYLHILPEAEHIMALLKSPGLVMGYTDWDAFLLGMQELVITGKEHESFLIEGADREILLEALRKDVENGDVLPGYFTEDYVYEVSYSYVQDGLWNSRYLQINKYAQNTMQWMEDFIAKQP